MVVSAASKYLKEWGTAVNEVAADHPTMDIGTDLKWLRKDLLLEEYLEYEAALFAENDVVALADALGDMVYVIFGTARVHGIDLDAVLEEIHRSNMTKMVGGKPLKAENGKVLKGPKYEPPNLAKVLMHD